MKGTAHGLELCLNIFGKLLLIFGDYRKALADLPHKSDGHWQAKEGVGWKAIPKWTAIRYAQRFAGCDLKFWLSSYEDFPVRVF